MLPVVTLVGSIKSNASGKFGPLAGEGRSDADQSPNHTMRCRRAAGRRVFIRHRANQARRCNPRFDGDRDRSDVALAQ
jgi:hypothetical protein